LKEREPQRVGLYMATVALVRAYANIADELQAAQYSEAVERAEANARVLGNGKLGGGDYPLLGGGDVRAIFAEQESKAKDIISRYQQRAGK